MVTKLMPPRINSEVIERPRLLDAFSRNRDLKLIVVTAPAGYGKTVATLQHVNTLGFTLVWYQLDPYDNDLAVFIQYLIKGFQKHFPDFGAALLQTALQSNIASSMRFIITSLVNELAALSGRDVVLVLDDYHHLTDPVIRRFMEEWLTHLPTGIHVIIVGRTSPALTLSRFRACDEMAVIDSDTLQFNPVEVAEFLGKRRIDVAGNHLDTLIAKTGGWPAALKLLTIDSVPPVKENKYIYDYLANEVFDRQPEDIRQFLLAAAVIETITPEMCDLLMERNDSGAVLDFLEKQQLFLIPLAGPEIAYRYHQLFRDFLLERLGERRNIMWRKAGNIAMQAGNPDQAIEYYLSAGLEQNSLPLLVQAGREAFRQGRWQTVVRWLGMLAPEQIQANQWLCFFQAQIKIYQGKLDEAETWISKSAAHFSAIRDAIGLAECRFLQARILNGHGRHHESLKLLEEAFPVLQKAAQSLRFDLPLEMAITLFRNNHFHEAEQLLLKSLQAAEEQNEYRIMAHLLEGLGHAYYWMGDHNKALQCYKRGIQVSPNHTLPSYNFQDLTASIYQEWGELDAALEYAERSVAYKECMGMIEALPSAYYQLGSIWIDFKEYEKAEAYYRKGIDLAENGGERHFLSLNKAYLARCLGFQGRLAESLAVAEAVLAEAQNQSETLYASCRVICAPTFIQSGNIPKARAMLIEALPPLEKWNFIVPLSYGYATLAVFLFKTGDLRQAGELSHKLLDLAARKNLVRLFLTISEYHVILRYGFEHGIEVAFIQRILVRMRERGLDLLKEFLSHSDPEVRARAILPLSQINTPASQELLDGLSHDPNPEVQQTIIQYAALSVDSNRKADGNVRAEASAAEEIFKSDPSDTPGAAASGSEAHSILEIHLLGPTRIMLDNTDITTVNWRFTKSRDLLLYLCHHGQPVGINQILEDLWPDLPLEKGMKNFYSVLYWLRQAIQKGNSVELVPYTAKMCELVSSAYTTDRDRFISLINAGSTDINVSPRNVEVLEEALALYQGEYLSQLDYTWVIPEREHLKRLYLEAALRLAKLYLQNNDHLKTVGVLESIAEQNPLREEIFALLMSAYAALGDRLAVIRQYQKLKSNLMEELGLEPAPEITKLYYTLCGSDTPTRKRNKA